MASTRCCTSSASGASCLPLRLARATEALCRIYAREHQGCRVSSVECRMDFVDHVNEHPLQHTALWGVSGLGSSFKTMAKTATVAAKRVEKRANNALKPRFQPKTMDSQERWRTGNLKGGDKTLSTFDRQNNLDKYKHQRSKW